MNRKNHLAKALKIIVLLFLGGIAVVTILFFLSIQAVHKFNVFVRQFPPHALGKADTFDLGFNSYYIAGVTTSRIFLGNSTSPLHVLVLPISLRDSQHVNLRSPEIESTKFWSLKLKIDSPDFFLADGAVPRIFTGHIDTWVPHRVPYDSAFFVDYEPLSSSMFGIRSVSSATNEFVLGKQSLTEARVKLSHDLLQKQIDGRFCVDGMLHYNKYLQKLIYVYYYRNQFIVYDTALNLAWRGNTIDTVSHARITIASVSSQNVRTYSAPPLVVNKYSCTSGNLLFINSGLLAKNEDQSTFEQSSVIDVYDLAKNEYRFSFYIPAFSGRMIHDFYVRGTTLIVLTDRYVMTYPMARHYFADE
jgi:hypothetical protein